MRLLIVIISLALCVFGQDTKFQQELLGSVYQDACDDINVVEDFRHSYDDFVTRLYKTQAPHANYFFASSPYTVWLTLAAIAEGADHTTRNEIFKVLNLPQDVCTRQKFHQIASTRISSNTYAIITNTRTLVIDEDTIVNPNWYNLISQHNLLEIVPAPIKRDSVSTSEIIKQQLSANINVDLNGNSVLLNTIDFNSLWTSTFEGASIERSPFYDHTGKKIGSVDLMRVRRMVRVGYAPSIFSKVLEMSVGNNEEYKTIFALVDNDTHLGKPVTSADNYTISLVFKILGDAKYPVEVAIPRIVINSVIDMKDILMDLGLVNLWKDPGASRYTSTPPAQPSAFIQRASVTFSSDSASLPSFGNPSYQHPSNQEWEQFVANKPFIFGLFDAETYTCLMAAMYTQPTFPY